MANLQGYNMVRSYLSDADPAMVHAMLLRSDTGPANHPTSMNYLETATRYADGTAVSTRNGDLSTVFDEPPHIDVAVRRTAHRAADLKAAHDRRTESFIWTFLLAWFPLRLLGPSVWPALLLSLLAAGLAGSVCGHRMRRKALV